LPLRSHAAFNGNFRFRSGTAGTVNNVSFLKMSHIGISLCFYKNAHKPIYGIIAQCAFCYNRNGILLAWGFCLFGKGNLIENTSILFPKCCYAQLLEYKVKFNNAIITCYFTGNKRFHLKRKIVDERETGEYNKPTSKTREMLYMCNIAGYVGTKQAAPILLEMLRKQEGLDSGFFTGIATIHEGKIYYAKVVGDINTLLEQTDAASLPGTIGIIHSRTPGGVYDNREWAHPFTTERDGEVRSALVLNGMIGRWSPQMQDYLALGKQLHTGDYPLKSEVYAPGKPWTIGNDIGVHNSDIFAQLMAKHIDDGADAATALWNTYARMPEEIATLALSVTEPNAIAWGRMDFPMFRVTVEDGTYLATSPLALPEESHELLPAAAAGLVYKDGYTCRPFGKELRDIVAPITPELMMKVYDIICQALQEDRQIVNGLFRIISRTLGKEYCYQIMPMIYEITWDLHRQGRLVIEEEYIRGQTDALKAPKKYMRLKEN